MTNCETLPLCPDLPVSDTPVLTEPMEVGPFSQGVVFVKLRGADDDASPSVSVDIGISPSGYEDWDLHWATIESQSGLSEPAVYAFQMSNFGNWLRLKFENNGDPTDVLAWFVGDA